MTKYISTSQLNNLQRLCILQSKHPGEDLFKNSLKATIRLSKKISLAPSLDLTERRVSLLFATLSAIGGEGVCSFRTDRINVEVGFYSTVSPNLLGLRSDFDAFTRLSPWTLQSSDTGFLRIKSFSGGNLLRPFQKLFWEQGLDLYLQVGSSSVDYIFGQRARYRKHKPKLQEGVLRLSGVPIRVSRPPYLNR